MLGMVRPKLLLFSDFEPLHIIEVQPNCRLSKFVPWHTPSSSQNTFSYRGLCEGCQCSQWLCYISPYSANTTTQNYQDGVKERRLTADSWLLASASPSLCFTGLLSWLLPTSPESGWEHSLSLGSQSHSQSHYSIISHSHKADAEQERSAQSPLHPQEDLKVACIAVPPVPMLFLTPSSPFVTLVTGSQCKIPLAIKSQVPPKS